MFNFHFHRVSKIFQWCNYMFNFHFHKVSLLYNFTVLPFLVFITIHKLQCNLSCKYLYQIPMILSFLSDWNILTAVSYHLGGQDEERNLTDNLRKKFFPSYYWWIRSISDHKLSHVTVSIRTRPCGVLLGSSNIRIVPALEYYFLLLLSPRKAWG